MDDLADRPLRRKPLIWNQNISCIGLGLSHYPRDLVYERLPDLPHRITLLYIEVHALEVRLISDADDQNPNHFLQ